MTGCVGPAQETEAWGRDSARQGFLASSHGSREDLRGLRGVDLQEGRAAPSCMGAWERLAICEPKEMRVVGGKTDGSESRREPAGVRSGVTA